MFNQSILQSFHNLANLASVAVNLEWRGCTARHRHCKVMAIALCLGAAAPAVAAAPASVQLGPRPFYLVDQLEPGSLKESLAACAATTQEYLPTKFSIGHRGAPLQFPEHTAESYSAAAQMGAGIVECDVTFTADAELVCRHAQCDLHTTTNILASPLAQKCSVPFTPAEFGSDGKLETPAAARCCASDLTLPEFKSLQGKMDVGNASATTVEEYIAGSTPFRTDLYATGGTLLSHAESIELIGSLGAGFTPELKEVTDGFGESGLTQDSYASKMIQEYVDAGVPSDALWPQSFNFEDVRLWLKEFPSHARQAVFLEGRSPEEMIAEPPTVGEFKALAEEGLQIIAPPMPLLLQTDANGEIVPSGYARNVKAAGLDIISWSLERSGRIVEDVKPAGGAFYYESTVDALNNDGDILKTVDVLAQEVGIIGLFSDWPATTSFYANCLGLK